MANGKRRARKAPANYKHTRVNVLNEMMAHRGDFDIGGDIYIEDERTPAKPANVRNAIGILEELLEAERKIVIILEALSPLAKQYAQGTLADFIGEMAKARPD